MAERILARTGESIAPTFALRPQGNPPLGVEELHELRVRIPVNLHRQLLSLKVLRGRSLAETVSLALDNYFAQVKAPPTASLEEEHEQHAEP
jgi:hypothetical protein